MASSKKTGSTQGADKSVAAFRDSLEKSLSLTRERIQEVTDEAVSRGRMTRNDANDLVASLVSRGRQQSEDLAVELEALIAKLQKQLESTTAEARKRAEKAAGKAAKAVRDATEEPRARADEIRRRVGVGSDFPISGYEELTAAQIKSRLGKLDAAELRKVRDHEKKGKARKGILTDVAKRLG